MKTERFDTSPLEAPLDQLERALIDEYLRGRGYDLQHLDNLPEHDRHELLADASVYASTKLTEVESRSRHFQEMHHGVAAYWKRSQAKLP